MMPSPNVIRSLRKILLVGVLSVLALSMLLPFLLMLSTSLMNDLEVYQFPPKFIPSVVRWSNYVEAMSLQPF